MHVHSTALSLHIARILMCVFYCVQPPLVQCSSVRFLLFEPLWNVQVPRRDSHRSGMHTLQYYRAVTAASVAKVRLVRLPHTRHIHGCQAIPLVASAAQCFFNTLNHTTMSTHNWSNKLHKRRQIPNSHQEVYVAMVLYSSYVILRPNFFLDG